MASEYDPEFDKYVKHAHENLIPRIEGNSIFMAITPGDKFKTDVKFATEIGFALMFDKPIIAIIRPGQEIPEKLARVVDRWVEVDFDKPMEMQSERIRAALTEMCKELKLGQ